MDVNEIKKKKAQLVRDIYSLITNFHEATDVYIDSVNYDLINVTSIGDTSPQYEPTIYVEIKI